MNPCLQATMPQTSKETHRYFRTGLMLHCVVLTALQNFVDMVWMMGDLLIVCSDTADVLIFEQFDLKKVFNSIHPHKSGLTTLCAFSSVCIFREHHEGGG